MISAATVKINCHIGIDAGDRSVGIPEGWDEETGVYVEVETDQGKWTTGATFEPEMDEPVGTWSVTQVWTAFTPAGVRGRTVSVVDVEKPTTWRRGAVRPVRQTVADLPPQMQQAVADERDRFKRVLAEQRAAEDAWAISMQAAEEGQQ